MLLPLVIGGVCVITSIIGTFFVKLGANNSIMGALYKGFIAWLFCPLLHLSVCSAGSAGDTSFTTSTGQPSRPHLFYCMLVGLVITGLIIWVTEYYTGVELPPGDVRSRRHQ